MRIGVDYYPEHWEESLWEEDIRKMAETGVSVVRLAEFAWCLLEPQEGVYDFTWLDRVISMFGEKNIDVVLGTPTNCPPLWLYERYPETVQTGRDGRRIATGIRGHRCYTNPVFRRKTKEIVTALAQHYKDDKRVISWQIDNEVEANFCCCESCTEGFRGWLKEKYNGDLQLLNKTYGNVMWSGEYSSWQQIKPPMGDYAYAWYNPSYMLDFHRYASDSTIDFVNFQKDILKQITPDKPVTTNAYLCENMPDFYRMFKGLDFVSYDNYPVARHDENEQSYTSHAFHLDLMRGLKKQNFWVMEQLSGALGSWMPMGDTPRPGFIAGYSLQAFAHGADTVVHFRWRSATKGAEMHWHGLLDHSNIPGRRFEEFQQLCARSQKLKAIAGSRIESKVALLYSAETEYAFKIQPQHQDFHYLNQMKAYHEAFTSLGLNVDIVNWTSSLEGYEIVIAPTLYLVQEAVTEELYRFVREGGTLLLTDRSGVKDMDNTCIMDALPTVYQELMGASVMEYDAPGYCRQKLEAFFDSPVTWEDGGQNLPSGNITEYQIHGWCDLLKPHGAKVLAVYGDEYYKGVPAVTCNAYGKGYAYYVGTVADRDFYCQLAKVMVRQRNMSYIPDIPRGVEISKRCDESRSWYFLFNNSAREQTVRLPFAVRDVESDAVTWEAGQEITLAPAQMRIVLR